MMKRKQQPCIKTVVDAHDLFAADDPDFMIDELPADQYSEAREMLDTIRRGHDQATALAAARPRHAQKYYAQHNSAALKLAAQIAALCGAVPCRRCRRYTSADEERCTWCGKELSR